MIEGFEQPRRNAREILPRVAGLQISLQANFSKYSINEVNRLLSV